MAATQKYKVNNMAKDLDKKTKEIVELLKDKGFDGKSSSSVMENAEINIVLYFEERGLGYCRLPCNAETD